MNLLRLNRRWMFVFVSELQVSSGSIISERRQTGGGGGRNRTKGRGGSLWELLTARRWRRKQPASIRHHEHTDIIIRAHPDVTWRQLMSHFQHLQSVFWHLITRLDRNTADKEVSEFLISVSLNQITTKQTDSVQIDTTTQTNSKQSVFPKWGKDVSEVLVLPFLSIKKQHVHWKSDVSFEPHVSTHTAASVGLNTQLWSQEHLKLLNNVKFKTFVSPTEQTSKRLQNNRRSEMSVNPSEIYQDTHTQNVWDGPVD